MGGFFRGVVGWIMSGWWVTGWVGRWVGGFVCLGGCESTTASVFAKVQRSSPAPYIGRYTRDVFCPRTDICASLI